MNTPLAVLITLAYGVPLDRVLEIPEWARAEKFDVVATYNPERRYDRVMLQQLLEVRFALRLHRETRDMPVYELVRMRTDGQLGPRLRASTLECSPRGAALAECGVRITGSLVQGKAVDWRMVVDQLPGLVGRTVSDKSGLQGLFEVTLEWTPDPTLLRSPEAIAAATASAATATGERITIFTALQEQLGLRLQGARAPLEVVVIDRLERPTPD